MKSLKKFLLVNFLFLFIANEVMADRLKDMVSFAGIRTNQLMGYGIVVGLDGTGDSSLGVTLQSCLLYTSPSPRDLSTSRMPSSA